MSDAVTKNDLDKLEGRIEKRFDEKVDELTSFMERFINAFEARFQRIEDILDTKADKSDIDTVLNVLDHHTAVLDDHTVELAAISSQLSRHDRWNHEIADQIGYTLTT